jgi:hypothetical protein
MFLPALSRKQSRELRKWWDDYGHTIGWPSQVYSFERWIARVESSRSLFWVALFFCWSGVGLLVGFLSMMNYNQFIAESRGEGIPHPKALLKRVRYLEAQRLASYRTDEPVLEGELVQR